MDVVYIFNAGTSTNLEVQKKLARTINDKYEISQDSVNVAAIKNRLVEFGLREHLSNTAVNNAIDRIRYTSGSRNLVPSLELARSDVLDSRSKERKYSPSTIVLFFDKSLKLSLNNDELKQSLKDAIGKLQSSGVNFVVIGVGQDTGASGIYDVINDENSDTVFNVKDPKDLSPRMGDQLANRLLAGT